MSIAAGTLIGPYEILGPLGAGAGGMGEIFRARDTRLARDVAVMRRWSRMLDARARAR